MASLTTTEKILIAVLNQTRKEDGTYPTPDYDNLNRVLGLQSREAARLRVSSTYSCTLSLYSLKLLTSHPTSGID